MNARQRVQGFKIYERERERKKKKKKKKKGPSIDSVLAEIAFSDQNRSTLKYHIKAKIVWNLNLYISEVVSILDCLPR